MSSTTPHDETILKMSNALDEYIYAGLYKRGANQLEFSLSGLAHMTKVTKKLVPIKVYAFVMGVLSTIALLKVFSNSPVKGIIYMLIAYDSFQISYNSYERSYASIAGMALHDLHIISSPDVLERRATFFSGPNAIMYMLFDFIYCLECSLLQFSILT